MLLFRGSKVNDDHGHEDKRATTLVIPRPLCEVKVLYRRTNRNLFQHVGGGTGSKTAMHGRG